MIALTGGLILLVLYLTYKLNKSKLLEDQHRLVVESASDAIVTITDDNLIVFHNPAFSLMFNLQHMEGQPICIIAPPRLREKHREGMKRYLASGKRHLSSWKAIELIGWKMEGLDEVEFPIEMSFGEIRSNGRIFFTAVIRDISDRRSLERLREVQAKLEASNEELTSFTYSVSHDLQEPLRKVTAFSSKLQRTLASAEDPTVQDYLFRVIRSTERMQTLIDDLLALSRATTNHTPNECCGLNSCLNEAINVLELAISETGTTIEADELPTICYADCIQLTQVFQNLLSNSIKFRREGISPFIQIRYKEEVDSHLIIIQDNGIGFDNKYLPKIFKPFERLHSKDQYEGSGIGLALIKKVIEKHLGTISASGSPGVGATFTITLPKEKE